MSDTVENADPAARERAAADTTSTDTGATDTDATRADTADPLVSIEDLRTYYDTGGLPYLAADPVKAVDGVSFDVKRGETLALVGESGCGKTTLGRTLLGLEDTTGGRVIVDGTDVTNLSAAEARSWSRNAQMVFQDPDSSLNDRMTVGEIIREPLDAHDEGTPAERRERVFDLLADVGLAERHFSRYPHQFSGGQKQRVVIARALALEPNFLVLDEPVSALDVSVQARVLRLLEDLQNEHRLTYLFIAHDLSVVRHIADRVAVMYLGNVAEIAPTETLFRDPTHPYTMSLLSAIPGSAGPWDGKRIMLRGTPPNPRDPPQGCPFATRCPAKIRADGWDLDPDAWDAVEEFRTALRTRARAETPVVTRVARRIGFSDSDVDALTEDCFDGVNLPADAASVTAHAADLARRGHDRAAAEHLRETFGSPCDRDDPDSAADDDGRVSRCHRDGDKYADARDVLRDR